MLGWVSPGLPREEPVDISLQGFKLDRFTLVTVKSGGQGLFFISSHCIRRQGDDWKLGKSRILPERLNYGIAIQLGHLNVAEHQVRRCFRNFLQRFLTIGCFDNLISPALDELT